MAPQENTHTASPSEPRMPWYTEAILAFAGWITASFLSGFIFTIVMLTTLESAEERTQAIAVFITGALIAGTAAVAGRNNVNPFLRHMIIALVAGGIVSAVLGLWLAILGPDGGETQQEAGLALLIVLIPLSLAGVYLMRLLQDSILTFFLTVIIAGTALTSAGLLTFNAGLPLVYTICAAFALFATALLPRKSVRYLQKPAVVATALFFTGILGAHFYTELARWEVPEQISAFGTSLLNYTTFGLFSVAIYIAARRLDRTNHRGTIVALSVLTIIASWFLPPPAGGIFALLWAAFAARHKGLIATAIVAFALYLIDFYYDLEMTLLGKSKILTVIGLITLAIAFFIHRRGRTDAGQQRVHTGRHLAVPAIAVIALTTALFLARTNYGIHQLEKSWRESEVVLLPLGPRDPRSLIQGDYMVLNFDNDIYPDTETIKELPPNGSVILTVNADREASFSRLSAAESELRSSELRVQYTKDTRVSIRYCPESFFFQEGEAEKFNVARFAVIKVNAEGAVRLTALADENGDVIE